MSNPSLAPTDTGGNPPAGDPPDETPRTAAASFRIRVLGGAFHVRLVILANGRTAEQTVSDIENVPSDRWFVMVADHQDAGRDALAMVDDDLALRICAHGTLVQD